MFSASVGWRESEAFFFACTFLSQVVAPFCAGWCEEYYRKDRHINRQAGIPTDGKKETGR